MQAASELPLAHLGSEARLEELFETSPLRLAHDWFGKPLEFASEFFLAVSSKDLFFGARIGRAPRLAPSGSSDGTAFVEGLWEFDVVELFLKDDSAPHYRELNLSPDGRWWTCLFDSYRVRRPNSRLLYDPPEILSVSGPNGFEVALRFSRSMLQLNASFGESTRAVVAAILGAPPVRTYLSSNPVTGIAPDFHDTRGFLPLHSTDGRHVR
ncbi:MAG: hypothetical protein U0136_20595 [Bdellovibrionota bacterium]